MVSSAVKAWSADRTLRHGWPAPTWTVNWSAQGPGGRFACVRTRRASCWGDASEMTNGGVDAELTGEVLVGEAVEEAVEGCWLGHGARYW